MIFSGSSKNVNEVQQVLTSAAAVTWDVDRGGDARIVLGHNAVITIVNSKDGAVYTLELVQDGTGSRLPTFSSNVIWGDGGAAPTFTTTINKVDLVTFKASRGKLRAVPSFNFAD